jgi:Uncharacterized conserved protein
MWRFIGRRKDQIQLKILIVVEPDGEGFHASCPALKGLHANGATELEAVKNIAVDIPAYIFSLLKHGEPLPIGPDEQTIRHPEIPQIPLGAFLKHVTLQWPGLQTSGIS